MLIHSRITTTTTPSSSSTIHTRISPVTPIILQYNGRSPPHNLKHSGALLLRRRIAGQLDVAHAQRAQDMPVDAIEIGVGELALQVIGDLARGHGGGPRQAVDGAADAGAVLALPPPVRRDGVHLVGRRGRVVVPRVQDLHEPHVALALEPPRHGFPRAPALLALAPPLPLALRYELRAPAVAREVLAYHLAVRVVAPGRQLLFHRALLRDPVPGGEDVLLQREHGVFGCGVGSLA